MCVPTVDVMSYPITQYLREPNASRTVVGKVQTEAAAAAVTMSSVVAPELLESVYSFLMKNGHQATAKSLAKEAKLDEIKLKNCTPVNLMDICPTSLKYVVTIN
jgi:LisH